jgi:acetylornithine deacetylase
LTEGWLGAHRDELVELVRALVAIPSENRPPHGDERACQEYVVQYLRTLGLEPDVFQPDEVAGATEHPAWWPGRDYEGRTNVVARVSGRGGGRSLVFSGHIDVVPALGAGEHGYWDGDVADGRVYGRGSLDMKGGIACYLHALRCMRECGVELAGDLIVETVVDEEFGGANGTLACRLRGYEADGAILPEPTSLAVCHATRGGIQYRLNASGGAVGMAFDGGIPASPLVAVAQAAAGLARAERVRPVPIYQYLVRSGEELPWGTSEGIPPDAVLEFWAEIVPGTTHDELERELRDAAGDPPDGIDVGWEQRTRFLPATSIDPRTPIVEAVRRALDAGEPTVAPFACDAFIFNECSSTPVAICGPGGGNAHAPDEYVLVDDLHTLAAAYLQLALDWCGKENP